MNDPRHAAAIARLQLDLSDPGLYGGLPRGLIGAFGANGEPRHAYPEIAGYWLRWASGRAELPDPTAAALIAALAVLRLPGGLWPTRIGLGSAVIPARYRDAHYLYDHAMLWDGLRHWAGLRRCAQAALLADELWQALAAFAIDGRLRACIPAAGPGPEGPSPSPPGGPDAGGAADAGWACGDGPFLLKACARLLPGQGTFGRVCARSIQALSERALASPHPQAHPQLYAIEGLIELKRPKLARQALCRLLADHGGAAAITEQLAGGPRRSDVLAQLLRAVCLLGVDDPGDPGWARLAAEVAARVDRNGRLPFAEAADDRPTWAGMFALQALQLWSGQPLSGKALI
jgi:hypothetical protein